jgi:hypothetical protein
MARRSTPAAPCGVKRPLVRAWRLIGVAVVCLLALVGPAAAQSNFVWSGAAPAGASGAGWSVAENWLGGAAPSGVVGTLTFAALASSVCTGSVPSGTCYTSDNDLENITAQGMAIDDGEPYLISGDAITLGSGGITASPGAQSYSGPTIAIPIDLSAPQTWSVDGSASPPFDAGAVIAGDVTGPSDTLGVDLANGGALGLQDDTEVGAVSVVGSDSAESGDDAALNGSVYLEDSGRLNGADQNPVSVRDVELDAGPVGFAPSVNPTIGPLTSTGGLLDIESTLTVAGGVSLDSMTATVMGIAGPGTAGSGYSQLRATGNVALGGDLTVERPIVGSGALPCELAPGQTYTLISASGVVSGTFSNAPDGSLMSVGCGSGYYAVRIAYTAHTVTATILGAAVTMTAAPTTVATNRTVTLTATVSAFPTTAGIVQFDVLLPNGQSAAVPGCAGQPITAGVPGDQVSCQASFTAASSPEEVSATFAPAAGAVISGRASQPPVAISVDADPTSTALYASSSVLAAGSRVTYSATVTPSDRGPAQPLGEVGFFDGRAVIRGCSRRPLITDGSSSRATCTIRSLPPGSASITARYAGDTNFSASTSKARRVAVLAATTGRATKRTTTTAILHGVVDDGGHAVAWHFQFSHGAARSHRTPPQQISGRRRPVRVSWHLSDLSPGTLYHVRLVIATRSRDHGPRVVSRGRNVTFATVRTVAIS